MEPGLKLVEFIMNVWPYSPTVTLWVGGASGVITGAVALMVLNGRVKVSVRNHSGQEKAIADVAAIDEWTSHA